MRVLITGSSGMIGTNLGLALLSANAEVAGIDRRPNTWTDRIPTTLIELCPAGALSGFDWPADVVVHLAATAKVHATVEDPQLAHDNVTSSVAVLEYARKHRVPVILGSSREVYGNGWRRSTSEVAVRLEESASPYAASKIAMEAMGHSYRRCYGIPVIVLRFSNVYGRCDSDIERLERVIPLFIRNIADSVPVTVFGASKRLDFTYIDDCVNGIVRAIHALLAGQLTEGAINIASGKAFTLLNLAAFIGDALGKTPQIVCEPARVGEVTHYVAALHRARRTLGYRPEVFLPEGIRRALAWRSGVASLDGSAHPAAQPLPDIHFGEAEPAAVTV